MPDFRDPQWQAAVRNEDIARVIVQGRGAMPPFGDAIQAQGVAALVELIRGFGEAGARPQGVSGPSPAAARHPLPAAAGSATEGAP